MANAKIGGHSSYGYTFIESIDTTGKQLGSGDSGKIFLCDQGASNVSINLPKISSQITGWRAKFVIRDASAGHIFIIVYGEDAAGGTDGDADKIVYLEEGDSNTTDSAADVIRLTGTDDPATPKVKEGSWVEVFTDGSKWYAHVHAATDYAVPIG